VREINTSTELISKAKLCRGKHCIGVTAFGLVTTAVFPRGGIVQRDAGGIERFHGKAENRAAVLR
jgi:hypothetical protein